MTSRPDLWKTAGPRYRELLGLRLVQNRALQALFPLREVMSRYLIEPRDATTLICKIYPLRLIDPQVQNLLPP
jgi:hypothetical protein